MNSLRRFIALLLVISLTVGTVGAQGWAGSPSGSAAPAILRLTAFTNQALSPVDTFSQDPVSSRPRVWVTHWFRGLPSQILPAGYSPASVITLGLLTGFLSSLLGIGGGPLVVTALMIFYGLAPNEATATSSPSIMFITLFGAAFSQYLTPHTIDWGSWAVMTASSVGMNLYLKFKDIKFKNKTLKGLLFVVVSAISIKYLVFAKSYDVPSSFIIAHPHLVFYGKLILGAFLGFLHRVLGIGGGVVAVPVLTVLFGLSFTSAGATALAVVAATAVVSTFDLDFKHDLRGIVRSKPGIRWPLAKSIGLYFGIIGSAVGAVFKVWLLHLPNHAEVDALLKRTFGGILASLVVSLVYQTLRAPRPPSNGFSTSTPKAPAGSTTEFFDGQNNIVVRIEGTSRDQVRKVHDAFFVRTGDQATIRPEAQAFLNAVIARSARAPQVSDIIIRLGEYKAPLVSVDDVTHEITVAIDARQEISFNVDRYESGEIPPVPFNLVTFIRGLLDWYSNVHRGTGPNSIVSTKRLENAADQVLYVAGIAQDDRESYRVIFNSARVNEINRAGALIHPNEGRLLYSRDYGLPFGVTALIVRKDNLRQDLTEPPFGVGGGGVKKVTADSVDLEDYDSSDRYKPGTPSTVLEIAFARFLYEQARAGGQLTPAQAGILVDPKLKADTVLALPRHLKRGTALLEWYRQNILGDAQNVVGADGQVRTHRYADNAASSLTASPIADIYLNALRLPASQYPRVIAVAVQTILNFFGAPAEHYAFSHSSNTSEATNELARALSKVYADEHPAIVTTDAEHTTFNVPFRINGRRQFQLPVDKNGFIDAAALEHLLKDQKGSIRLVALTGASNVEGVGVLTRGLEHIREIARITHENGAELLVDGAQVSAHRPIDLEADGVDYFAFSGHKMGVPFGASGLIYRKQSKLASAIAAEDLDPKDISVAGLAALAMGLQILRRIGMSVIEHYEEVLTRHALRTLSSIPDLIVVGAHDEEKSDTKEPVFVINLKGYSNHQLSSALKEFGFSVRPGCFCAHTFTSARLQEYGVPDWGGTRVSLGLNATTETVDALAKVLAHLALEENRAIYAKAPALAIEVDALPSDSGRKLAIHQALEGPGAERLRNALPVRMNVTKLSVHFVGAGSLHPEPGWQIEEEGDAYHLHVWFDPSKSKVDAVLRIAGLATRANRHEENVFRPESAPPSATICVSGSLLHEELNGDHVDPAIKGPFLDLAAYDRAYPLQAIHNPERLWDLQGTQSFPAGLNKLFQLQGRDWLTYVAIAENGTATAIDPALEDVARIADLLQEHGARSLQILETHRHAEHRTGARALQAAFHLDHLQSFPVIVVGENSGARGPGIVLAGENTRLSAGEGLRLTSIPTPGHTGGCVSWLLQSDSGDGPAFVATGDTVFVGSLGRADFNVAGGDALTLVHSAQKIFALPPETVILPAHRTIGDKNASHVSTVGAEITAFNKEYAGKSPEEVAGEIGNKGEAVQGLADFVAYNTDLAPFDPYTILNIQERENATPAEVWEHFKAARERALGNVNELADARAALDLLLHRFPRKTSPIRLLRLKETPATSVQLAVAGSLLRVLPIGRDQDLTDTLDREGLLRAQGVKVAFAPGLVDALAREGLQDPYQKVTADVLAVIDVANRRLILDGLFADIARYRGPEWQKRFAAYAADQFEPGDLPVAGPRLGGLLDGYDRVAQVIERYFPDNLANKLGCAAALLENLLGNPTVTAAAAALSTGKAPGGLCGALLGGQMVLAAATGVNVDYAALRDAVESNEAARELYGHFHDTFGIVKCADLVQIRLGTPEGDAVASVTKSRCPVIVAWTLAKILDLLAEKGIKPTPAGHVPTPFARAA
jgi:selenocysteine lyase/cysteine desulfurase/glyoxylase-like metal-dependent hydrolase (beta-lactamase superfamily II)/uncharacterized membrane protein YfcA